MANKRFRVLSRNTKLKEGLMVSLNEILQELSNFRETLFFKYETFVLEEAEQEKYSK